MIDYNSITLNSLTEEEFNSIYNILKEDELVKRYVSFCYDGTCGIFFNNKLVGLYSLSRFIEDSTLSINMALLNEYRGIGIAKAAINKIVEIYGKNNPEVSMFVAAANPNNKSSNNSLKNSGWAQTGIYDETMLDEGAEFFYIFYKDNPYYKQKEESRRRIR